MNKIADLATKDAGLTNQLNQATKRLSIVQGELKDCNKLLNTSANP